MADKLRIPKLKTTEEINRVVRRVVRELMKGDMDPKRGNAIVYALKLAKELIEVGELEERVKRLEELMRANGKIGYEVKN
ncbi:hypothetical protein [Hydrogenivirga sp. 128-5-R1-1]|uniref:hypothetical protein n=1 Tax=Hydrogenivirga sp. 128-5-R1-1 TaxID=392423 RepID=UPI0005168102|nr:hypothetical protein [Hydrogenivirga sp. 128-5-R1-1]